MHSPSLTTGLAPALTPRLSDARPLRGLWWDRFRPDTIGDDGETAAIGPAPSVLGPWLATGFGLAALAALPATEPSEPPATMSFPVVVVAGETAMGGAQAHLTEVNIVASPALVGPYFDYQNLPLEALVGPDQVSIPSPAELPIPAQLDRFFAVTGEPTRALPAGYHHPMIGVGPSLGETLPAPSSTDRRDLPSAEAWAELRWCESRGDYTALNPSGKYRGAYQFDQATWKSVGGTGDPAAAPPDEQDRRARLLYERRGSSPWPFCGRYLD